MKRFFIIFFVLLMLPSFTVNAETDAFNDISGHWAQSSINTAAKMGLISGLPDGSFSPDSPVTLGEILAMLVPLVTGKKPKITDDDDWYAPYADEAFKCGILNSFTSDELAGFYNLPAIRVVNNVLFANTLVSLGLTPKHEITPLAVSKSRLGLSLYKDLNDIFNDVYIVSTYLCVAHNILKGTPQRTIE
ncbi:MAG: S-layer homology domain-containing protein, partial [Bacillota bacterium]|nr:S-layer homology domain-containing protein [Bacillota bacterium]